MKRIVFLVLALIILQGCSSLQLSGTRKKEIVDKISPNIIKVTFCGNAYMDQKEVERYAFQRASSEALAKGCSHFVVLNKEDQSKICALNSGMYKNSPGNYPPSNDSGDLVSSEFIEPNVTLTIQCIRKGEEIPENAIDAEKFLRENFPGMSN